MSKEECKQVIFQLLEVLSRCREPCSAFACAVHKESYPNLDPMKIAFEDLVNRFDLQLKRVYATEANPQRGMIILDESSYETSLQEMARNFRKFGTRWGTLRNLVDVPLFVKSRASRLVQLADHVAYAVFRRYNSGDTSYLDKILHRFDSEEGKIHGLVHKQTITPNCMCQACITRA